MRGSRRIDSRAHGLIIFGRAVARGVAAMMKNVVAGCVLAALILMGLLAFAQEHHECWNGHLIKAFKQAHLKALKPCGSVSPEM